MFGNIGFRGFTVSLLVGVFILAQPVLADEEKGHPNITSVIADIVSGEVHIYGAKLASDSSVRVTLGGEHLVIISAGDNWIDAYLPNGLTEGDYRQLNLKS